MGLKQSIVVVNEYSIKNKSGKGGSRGGSPGNYVLRYMARDGATEIATPVTLDNEAYILRYMARKEATETLDDEAEIRRSMSRNQKMGGVAFGNKGMSLSHTDLINSSKSIQNAFDQGKTVMKTVISFDEDYLRENGIVPEDFVFEEKGDYRGNIDQIKLRYAIMNGLEYLSHDYDDLQYVGVIQVDTAHVHCHLAMVDMGKGNITEDGTQKGKISAQAKAKLRRGIDMALDESKEIQYMASNVGIDRRNIQTNMKKYTYEQVTMYGAPQKLMSVLPEDERMWRASTNRKEMKEANKICRDYVERILAKPDSGMNKAMQSVYDYVDARTKKEDLDKEEQQKLIRKGRNDIVENCMNSVYSTLQQIPDKQRYISTDFINMTSAPMVTPSFKNDEQDFVYRMTAYHKRLDKHKSEAKRYTEFVNDYEQAELSGGVDPASKALYDYFLVEQEYRLKLSSKYSQFLFFEEPSDEITDEYLALAKRAEVLNNMESLANDKSAKRMKASNAEEYGRSRYDVYGGRYVVLDPDYFDRRVDTYRSSYDVDRRAFDSKLASQNLVVAKDDKGRDIIKRQPAYDFDDVKGLDLHDLRGDFKNTLEFSGYVRSTYVDMAKRRIDAYDKACEYLDASGQSELREVFDSNDIENMRFVLQRLEENRSVEPIEQPMMDIEEKRVIPLDKKMHSYINRVVKVNVQTLEYAEAMNRQDEQQAEEDMSILGSRMARYE